MKSLGSLRMGLISATPTGAATALALPAGKGETPRLKDETVTTPTQFHCLSHFVTNIAITHI